MRSAFLIIIWWLFFAGQSDDFRKIAKDFHEEYSKLKVPEFTLDHREYFNSVGSANAVQKQIDFYKKYKSRLQQVEVKNGDSLYAAHLTYEIEEGLKRTALEMTWLSNGAVMPSGGLHSLGSSWYSHFVRKFCSLEIHPDTIMSYGVSEVNRIKTELKSYEAFKTGDSIISNKEPLVNSFASVDSIVRRNMEVFFPVFKVPSIYPMEWPDAGPYTPPGIYLSKETSGYPKDVFQFNFSDGMFERKNIEWLYMHEAIPGHHLQSSFRKTLSRLEFQEDFMYPGNFEGWACYIEYLGKDLGLFKDTLQRIGHLKWEMVRSFRLILDAGIHYYGWKKEQCMELWKKEMPFDLQLLAEREVTRVTNWPGQALSYKIGAMHIRQLARKAKEKGLSLKDFHTWFLEYSFFPLEIIRLD